MIRPLHIWLIFGACLCVVLSAMGWLSVSLLHLDEAQGRARRHAAFEENVRLALWRIDSAIAPIIAQENARPYFAYSSFYPLNRAYGRMFNPKTTSGEQEILVPSALLTPDSAFLLVHFQVGPDARFTSPQAPTGTQREKAQEFATTSQMDMAQERLNMLAGRLSSSRLSLAMADAVWLQPQSSLPDSPDAQTAQANTLALALNPQNNITNLTILPQSKSVDLNQNTLAFDNNGLVGMNSRTQIFDNNLNLAAQNNGTQNITNLRNVGNNYDPREQQDKSNFEFQQRARVLDSRINGGNSINPLGQQSQQGQQVQQGQAGQQNFLNQQAPVGAPFALETDLLQSAIKPIWMGDLLILSRRVSINSQEYIQGCWVDWESMRQWLKLQVHDLLPLAELKPAADTPSELERRLATLPVTLDPGNADNPQALAADVEVPSPIRTSLTIAWLGVVLASIAVAFLLQGTLALSERRAAFVSSVTHELRTPLTTFRLYSDLLADGKVRDPAKQAAYLATLRREADRLTRLVENVLAYARLERGGPQRRIETVTLGQMIERARVRLDERTTQAAADLSIEVPDDLSAQGLNTDVAAVEQILFNLVDNACKYAAGAGDRRIHVRAGRDGDFVRIQVCDHGPGISSHAAARLFQPFSRNADEAANSPPGIGLGLALCRRLARTLGGDLTVDVAATDGACLVLRLPINGRG